MVAHELHHLRAELLPVGRAVADAAVVHQVGQPHHPQADAAGAVGGLFELRDGGHVGVGLDDVIQEDGREDDRLAQGFPIHRAVRAEVLGQIHRAEAAVLVGAEPLLAARVGRFQGVEVGDGVGAVGRVEEEHARLAVVVGLLDDAVEQVAGAHGGIGAHGQPGRLGLLQRAAEALGSRVGDVEEAQLPIGVLLDGAHEGIRDADGDVEVGDRVFVGLAGDELFDIRVVDAQHAHVGAAARAALGDLAEGVVVDAQEAHRPGGLPGGGLDHRSVRAQAREGEAVAAAGLLDQGGVAQGLEDAGRVAAHVIDDGQDEAGGQLPERGAGAGEGGRIGEEFLAG